MIWGFESRQGLKISLSTTAFCPALGPTQPPIQRVPGALFLGVKRRGVKLTTHLHLKAEVKNAWNCISTAAILLHGVVLYQKMQKDSLAERLLAITSMELVGCDVYRSRECVHCHRCSRFQRVGPKVIRVKLLSTSLNTTFLRSQSFC
jgi:hypothetical protein